MRPYFQYCLLKAYLLKIKPIMEQYTSCCEDRCLNTERDTETGMYVCVYVLLCTYVFMSLQLYVFILPSYNLLYMTHMIL